MASSPAYQLRHCIMHLNKVLGNVSALAEKSFHGESINEAALDLAERRLPDLQAFVFKIASLADLRLGTEFSQFGLTLQQASQGSAHDEMDIEWLEVRLVRFEEAMAIFTKLHAPLMDRPTIPPVMRAEIKAALMILQAVAIDFAHYLQVDLDRNYRDRLLAVEHRKLA